MEWPPHKFEEYPGGRWPNSCVKCGKSRAAPVHIVEEDEVKKGG